MVQEHLARHLPAVCNTDTPRAHHPMSPAWKQLFSMEIMHTIQKSTTSKIEIMIIMYVPPGWCGAEVGSPKPDKTGTCSEPSAAWGPIQRTLWKRQGLVARTSASLGMPILGFLISKVSNQKCFFTSRKVFTSQDAALRNGTQICLGLAKPWPSSGASVPDS